MPVEVTEEVITVEESDETNVVLTTTTVVETVAVGIEGPQGPQGSTGATGPAGPQGTSGGSYEHSQLAPEATWTIAHNLGYRPNVMVEDSAGTEIIGDITHVSVNQMTITFSSATAGTAYLS